jgi:hypothetical protein
MSDNANDMNQEQQQSPSPSGSDDINLSFALTRTDLFWYNMHFIRLLIVGAIAFFILAIAVFVYSLNAPPGDYKTTLVWMVMGFGAGFSICAGSIAVVVLQIYFVKSEAVDQAMTIRNYIVNSSGIAVYNDKRRITRTWHDIKKVVKTRHGFYIKTGDKIAIVLPRHVFAGPEQIQLFERHAAQVQH